MGFRARDLCSDSGDHGAGGEAAQSGRATHADIHIHTFRHLVWLSLSTHKHRTPFTDARPVDYSRCLYENTHRRHARSITFYRWPTTVLQNESRSGLRGLLGWEPMVRNRFRTSPTLSDPCASCQITQREASLSLASLASRLPCRSSLASPGLSLAVTRRSPRSSLVARRSASSLHPHRAPRSSELALFLARLLPLSLLVTRLDCHSSLRRSPRSPPSPLVRRPHIARPQPRSPRSSPVAPRSSLVPRCSSLEYMFCRPGLLASSRLSP